MKVRSLKNGNYLIARALMPWVAIVVKVATLRKTEDLPILTLSLTRCVSR
ncbi:MULTISPECIES: hypothetical protein [Pseudomonas]|jgi:hypothetical protein|nr:MULTISPECIES: hypothetical protein [Pseudomonas]TCV64198.1 hypothetical protein EDB98_11085 [Pseudomonas fluorescens]SFW65823.1 hypothetical protein SAMN03159439_03430 [Pseudomonas sp. NFACC04-2]